MLIVGVWAISFRGKTLCLFNSHAILCLQHDDAGGRERTNLEKCTFLKEHLQMKSG